MNIHLLLPELFSLLNAERRLLQHLFEYRYISASFSERPIIQSSLISQEKLERLLHAGLLERIGTDLYLNSHLQYFLESYLGLNHGHAYAEFKEQFAALRQIIESLEDGYREWQDFSPGKNLIEIVRRLCQSIPMMVAGLDDQIRTISWTYDREEHRKEAWSHCKTLLHEMESELKKLQALFSTSWMLQYPPRIELQEIILELKEKYLDQLERMSNIRQFLYALESGTIFHSPFYIKLQRIKYVKDRLELRRSSNLIHLLQEAHAVCLQTKISFTARPALSELEVRVPDVSLPKKGKKRKLSVSGHMLDLNESTMNNKLPEQTASIFERLSKGLFISANSSDPSQAFLFTVIDSHFEELHEYFSHIQFFLEKGADYYYFSRPETKTSLEDKINRLYRYIDLLDFFKTFHPAFGPGFRFTPEDIVHACKAHAHLRTRLRKIRIPGNPDSEKEKIQRMIDGMKRDTFLELENELDATYLVLHAFSYLERLIEQIEIN